MSLIINIGNVLLPLAYYYILGLGMFGIYAIFEGKFKDGFIFKLALSVLYLVLVLYLDSVFKLAQKISGMV